MYQQQINEINEYFSKYKGKKIVFSSSVSRTLGLIQKDTSLKIGSEVFQGALLSSTMENLEVLIKLESHLIEQFSDQNIALIVHLKFNNKESGKNEIFTIYAKITGIKIHDRAHENIYVLSLNIKRKISNELILLYGFYHEKNREKLLLKKKKMACHLLSGEAENDCIAEKISPEAIDVYVEANCSAKINSKSIVIIKIQNTGEVFEIIGRISHIENEDDGGYHLVLNYSLSEQSPRFGYSMHVLKNLINF